MEEFSFDSLKSWMELTDQQFDVLKSIYSLEILKEETKPKNIKLKYLKYQPSGIQKSNLFGILRQLLNKSLIVRGSQAQYHLNFNGIRDKLLDRKRYISRESEELGKIYAHTGDYFKRHFSTPERPVVRYLMYESLFVELVKAVQKSKSFSLVGRFPNIFFTLGAATGAGREKFVKTLQDRALKKKDLRVLYLTAFDVGNPFTHSLKAYGDPRLAYKECEKVINNVEDWVDEYPNLEVRYIEHPYGFDIALPERDELDEFYFFVRDKEANITGGIHIRSKETARQAKEIFLKECEEGVVVSGKKGKHIMKKVRKNLKERYGKFSG